MDASLKNTIRKYALQNAIRFNGKANLGAVIGKVLGENPNLKEKAKDFPRKKTPLWGQAIKQLMEEKKTGAGEITVQSLSKLTGINDKHLFNILAQRVRDPSSDKLVKIADALGVGHGELALRRLHLGGAAPGTAHPVELLHRRLLRGDRRGIGHLGLGGTGRADRQNQST